MKDRWSQGDAWWSLSVFEELIFNTYFIDALATWGQPHYFREKPSFQDHSGRAIRYLRQIWSPPPNKTVRRITTCFTAFFVGETLERLRGQHLLSMRTSMMQRMPSTILTGSMSQASIWFACTIKLISRRRRVLKIPLRSNKNLTISKKSTIFEEEDDYHWVLNIINY